jgi:trk system potassium uptake protein
MNKKFIVSIIGIILVVNGLFMLLTSLFGFFYNESDSFAFVKSGTISMSTGLFLFILFREKVQLTIKDGFIIVTFTWLMTALVGALPFYLGGYALTFTDAFFESMSGVTTTGASIFGNQPYMQNYFPHLPNGIESLPHGILFWRSFIQWIGGMGIVVFTIAILPLLGVGGYQLFKAEVPGPVADKITPRIRETAKNLWYIYIGFTAVEFVLLSLTEMNWFDALCHSLTTMPTGGFSTKNASIGYYGSTVHYIIIFFMFVAGINFSLHFRALRGDFKSFWKDHEFKYYLRIIFWVTLTIFIVISASNAWSHTNLRDALFQTVSIVTTTGFGTENYEVWPHLARYLLFTLMFIGGMGGSTGGGIKIIRIGVVVKHILYETKRTLHSRAIIPVKIGNQYISETVVRNTLGFFLFYILIFAFTTLVLTALNNIDIETSMGAAASALGNIGPALKQFGPSENYVMLHPLAKWLLSFDMLLGRLEIFTVMVLISRKFWIK